jgi:pilus assembly protein CpaF
MTFDPDLVGRIRRRLTDSAADASQLAVLDAVRAEPARAALGGTSLLNLSGRLHDELTGPGPLAALLADPMVTDVVVNGPSEVWVDRGAGMARTDVTFPDPDGVRRLAQRLAASCERRLDDAHPYVDARLTDGTRLHAVLPPVAVGGPYLSLRTFRHRAFGLDELVANGCLTAPAARLVAAVVRARLAYLVTGGTGSGKTTMLASLLSLVASHERIVIVEDAAELRPSHPHVVALQARTSNVEGAGAITLRDLVRQAMRMRPDRLVVGECRGSEIVDLLGALNTGHEGGAGTLHANTAADVPARLEVLGLLGGLPRSALHAQVAAGLQVVLHMGRVPVLGRSLEEISLLTPSDAGFVRTISAWRRRDGPGEGIGRLVRLLAERGVELPTGLS